MEFNALDFVQGFGGQIAFSAMGATDDGDVFNDKEVVAFAVTPADVPYAGTGFSTNIANDFFFHKIHLLHKPNGDEHNFACQTYFCDGISWSAS